MGNEEPMDEWLTVNEDGSSPDISREQAAYQRERERLVRDHLGKIAVVRFDEVVGVYDDINQATIACRLAWRERRLDCASMPLREATDEVTRYTGVQFEFADLRTAETRISVVAPALAIAAAPTSVLPAPQGSTTTPEPPSQNESAAISW